MRKTDRVAAIAGAARNDALAIGEGVRQIRVAPSVGSRGVLDSHYNGYLKITGDNPWPGVPKDDTFRGGAVANVKAFVESIRSGKLINNAAEGSDSTLTAILGRMAAYTGKPVAWEDMMRSGEKFDTKISI